MSQNATDASVLRKVARMAKGLGKGAAAPMLQSFIREQVVSLLTEHDPEMLERFINVNYALVRKELPDQYRNVLGNIGPEFAGVIEQMVRPPQILAWLDQPEEWMDDEQLDKYGDDVAECARIIRETPGGEEWLGQQCLDFYDICGIL